LGEQYKSKYLKKSGECVNDKMIGVRKENVRFSRRWINRQIEDFEAGEGPRIIIKPSHGLKHQIPVTKVPKTTSTSTAPTKQPAVFNDNNPENEPWLISQSPESSHPSHSSDSVTYFPSSKNKSAAIIDDRLHTHNLFQRLSIRHSMGYSKIS
jgi:hypothetical protein